MADRDGDPGTAGGDVAADSPPVRARPLRAEGEPPAEKKERSSSSSQPKISSNGEPAAARSPPAPTTSEKEGGSGGAAGVSQAAPKERPRPPAPSAAKAAPAAGVAKGAPAAPAAGVAKGAPAAPEEPKDVMKMVHQAAKRAQQQQRQFQTLVVGTHTGAGKTTLLDRWLTPGGDVKDVKPTLALEYKYFKRPGRGTVAKEVAHVWELGSGTKLAKLIDAPLNEATVTHPPSPRPPEPPPKPQCMSAKNMTIKAMVSPPPPPFLPPLTCPISSL